MTDEVRRDARLSTSDIAGSNPQPADAAVEERGRQGTTTEASADVHDTPLFSPDEADGFKTRWSAIQTAFVDEPRKAVEEADTLVAEVMKRLAEVFAQERTELERQWDRGEQISTEDLRIALRRYRSFFTRLLAV
jgi:hypothetical protein